MKRITLAIATGVAALMVWMAWPSDGGEDWTACFPSPMQAERSGDTRTQAMATLRAHETRHRMLKDHKQRELHDLQTHVEWGIEEQQLGLGAAVFTTQLEIAEHEEELLEVGDTMGCLEDL